jgi:hypothetical protein
MVLTSLIGQGSLYKLSPSTGVDMTAYRNNFLVIEDADGTGSGTGSEGFIGYFEPAMIDFEILTSEDGDIVMMEADYAT